MSRFTVNLAFPWLFGRLRAKYVNFKKMHTVLCKSFKKCHHTHTSKFGHSCKNHLMGAYCRLNKHDACMMWCLKMCNCVRGPQFLTYWNIQTKQCHHGSIVSCLFFGFTVFLCAEYVSHHDALSTKTTIDTWPFSIGGKVDSVLLAVLVQDANKIHKASCNRRCFSKYETGRKVQRNERRDQAKKRKVKTYTIVIQLLYTVLESINQAPRNYARMRNRIISSPLHNPA